MEEGFGYQLEVSNLRKIFKAYGIEEKSAAAQINHILSTGAREDDRDRLIMYFTKKGVPAEKASTLLDMLDKSSTEFERQLI